MLLNNPFRPALETVAIAIAALFVLLMLQGAAFPQDPGPTPVPASESLEQTGMEYGVQEELAQWWGWCLRHGNVVFRPSKNWRVIGRGECGRQGEEKLKVTGAPAGRPPFASMTRTQGFRPFVRDGFLVGLWSDGWSYQTSPSTDIGVGPPVAVIWTEGVPE